MLLHYWAQSYDAANANLSAGAQKLTCLEMADRTEMDCKLYIARLFKRRSNYAN